MRLTSRFGKIAIAVITVGLAASETKAQSLTASFLPSGVTRKIGGYRPLRSVMTEEAGDLSAEPKNLENPHYGFLEFGEHKWAFILDERTEEDNALYLDSNGDGDLTNDPDTQWTPRENNGLTLYFGKGEIILDEEKSGTISFYRFDPADERRASLKDSIFYYGDFGYQYELQLDDQKFSTFISGSPTDSTRLPIDRDRNGRTSSRFEMTKVGEPFNFTGTTYVFRLTDGQLSLDESEIEVEQMSLPPDLRLGKSALDFTAQTMDGDEIEFPNSFKGKLVMLDFWATWCGPCIREIPHMKVAYRHWREHGFEILGISFDHEGMEDRVTSFLEKNEQTWPQIYEGKGWNTSLGNQHDINSIPFVLLVDGDTGKIVATESQLRGEGLSTFIKQQLEKKFAIELDDPVEKAEETPPESSDENKSSNSDDAEAQKSVDNGESTASSKED